MQYKSIYQSKAGNNGVNTAICRYIFECVFSSFLVDSNMGRQTIFMYVSYEVQIL